MSGQEEIPSLTVEEIYSQFCFIFICSGIIMSVVVSVGIIGNLATLVLLCRKSLRSAPVCLLQCLTVHALVNMLYAVYSDIEPAIRSYVTVLDMIGLYQDVSLRIDPCEKQTIEKNTTPCRNNMLACQQSYSSNLSVSNNGTNLCYSNPSFQNLVKELITLPANGHHNSTIYLLQNLTHFEYSFLGNASEFLDESIEITSFIRKAIERFFAYTIVFFGLLITICLALERCIAVYVPLQAFRLITVHRTRLAIIGIVVLCVLVHLPQVLREITHAVNSPEMIRPETGDLLIASWRRDYERFYTVSGLFLCVVLFFINVAILQKITALKKRYASFKHIGKAEHAEINITLILVVLFFFQLPLYIFINVVTFISKEKYVQNFSLMTKLLTFIRLLYISQSAASFLIYCVLARKFREALRGICDNLNATSGLIGHFGHRADRMPMEDRGKLKIAEDMKLKADGNLTLATSECNDIRRNQSKIV